MTMDAHFLKLLDKELAEQLKASGFLYVIEKQNKQDIYVFPLDSKLVKLITSLGVQEFVCESKLRF